MNEPRRPIFGFLWPKPDPDAPVDQAYSQTRTIRITPRGPLRVIGLVATTVATTIAAGSMIMAAISTSLSTLTVAGGAVVATLLVLSLRGWVVGTYVNDRGMVIETTWRQVTVPWTDVAAVTRMTVPCPFLGVPARWTAERVVVLVADGDPLPTHCYTTSPDLWGRPEAYDIAALLLARWFQESSPDAS